MKINFLILCAGFLFFSISYPVSAATVPIPTPVVKAKPAPGTYQVVKVIDGDTIDVQIGKKVERIRMIGMDTPETVDPRKPVQCFGKEASARTKELLLNKHVQLVADATQGDKDKYARPLRYVILDGLNFNKRLIAEGYAHEYTYNIPYKHQAVFKAAQKAAQAGKKGLWADKTCAGKTTASAKISPTPTPKPAAVQPAAAPEVKKSEAGLCHEKGSKYYDQTKKFTAYKTIKECLASGGKMPKQ